MTDINAMRHEPLTVGNFTAVYERGEGDNFHTSIYEDDYKGLLICRCNQNGRHFYQVPILLAGLDAKREAALSAAHAEPVDVRAGGINSAVPVAIRPSPFREDLDMVAVAAEAEKQPVAWRVHDWADGWILFDNEARARHEADNSTGVIEPLFASPSEAAIRADERAAIRKEAFEEAARVAEEYARQNRGSASKARSRAAKLGRIGDVFGHGEMADTAAMELDACGNEADAIATAIRARGER